MATLVWDEVGKKFAENGVERGVLYLRDANGAYPAGVAWSGLTNVTEKPSGAEPTALWADNVKYLTLTSPEEVALGIEAYMYPDEFEACDGSVELDDGVVIGQQSRATFGLSYRTNVLSDLDSALGYKLHIVYGCTAAPSERAYSTVNDSPEANTFSWEVTSVPVDVPGHKPTSIVTIDSRKVDPLKLAELEDLLYGTATTPAELPLPSDIIALLAA